MLLIGVTKSNSYFLFSVSRLKNGLPRKTKHTLISYYKSLSEKLLSVNNPSINRRLVYSAFYIMMQMNVGALEKSLTFPPLCWTLAPYPSNIWTTCGLQCFTAMCRAVYWS